MSTRTPKGVAFACNQCKAGKRKCDGRKPHCSLCSRLGKPCAYPTETQPKKRKYWDEEYVKGLEQQVQTLLALVKTYEEQLGLPSSSTATPSLSTPLPAAIDRYGPLSHPQEDGPSSTEPIPSSDALGHQRSQVAMEEVSTMMWRMNLGDGATIIHDSTHAASYSLAEVAPEDTSCPAPPAEILCYCLDRQLLSKLATSFLDNINQEHQFTDYRSTSFLQQYPDGEIDKNFLHTAILATGAAFLASRDSKMAKVSEDFARYAESLVFDCCRNRATLYVIQGMCILSFRALSIGKDHLGWMFISIAGGLCVHLRLHVLAVEECAARSLQPSSSEIRTFWMFYFVDKSAITILGRNCALPWRRVNVPRFDSTFDTETADLAEVSFAWQCRLWYSHDGAMDQIFASSFEMLPLPQQVRLLVSTLEQLNAFFRARPHRLDLSQEAPKPVLLFHLQYHMAILITISSFLRVFAADGCNTAGGREGPQSQSIPLVLRSITSSAIETVRLCRIYRDRYSYIAAHPILLHHLLSAALVHLMNATSDDISLQRQSARWLRTCLALLEELRATWPVRVGKSVKVIRVLAHKWGVVGALPMQFAGRIEPFGQREEVDETQTDAHGHALSEGHRPADIADFQQRGGEGFASETRETYPLDASMPNESSAAELLEAFESLSSLPDLGWWSDPNVVLPFS